VAWQSNCATTQNSGRFKNTIFSMPDSAYFNKSSYSLYRLLYHPKMLRQLFRRQNEIYKRIQTKNASGQENHSL
jgi:hypothetical protein